MAFPKYDSISRNWLNEMEELLENGENRANEREYMEDGACIYTVSESLRKERPGAYIPRVVSLGPFHHFKSEFSRSENCKNEFVLRIVKKSNGRAAFGNLAHRMSSQFGERIRNSYEQCEYENEVLGWMMAKDALFLLDVLGSDFEHDLCENVQSVHKVFDPKRKGPLLFAIQADILKLENQIPMFVLEEVLQWQKGSKPLAIQSLRDVLKVACRELSPFLKTTEACFDPYQGSEKHMVESLYNSILSPSMRRNVNAHVSIDIESSISSSQAINPHPHHGNEDEGSFMAFIRKWFAFCGCSSNVKTSVDLPPATELQRRGVKFMALKTGRLDEIRFASKTHTLNLTAIRMDDRTEVVLRNLVAHEALVELQTRALLSYVDLMDRLIDTPSDVAVLKRYGGCSAATWAATRKWPTPGTAWADPCGRAAMDLWTQLFAS